MNLEPLALTVPQTAKLLNLAPSTVHLMIRDGELPAVVICGKRRVLRKTLEQWLDRQPTTTE